MRLRQSLQMGMQIFVVESGPSMHNQYRIAGAYDANIQLGIIDIYHALSQRILCNNGLTVQAKTE